MAWRRMFTCSGGVPGGKIDGVPICLKVRTIASSFRSLSDLANSSISGKRSNPCCFRPLGTSMMTWRSMAFFAIRSALRVSSVSALLMRPSDSPRMSATSSSVPPVADNELGIFEADQVGKQPADKIN